MDDKTALAVWAQLRDRVPTGVQEAAALIQFTQWVQEKGAPPKSREALDDPDNDAAKSEAAASA